MNKKKVMCIFGTRPEAIKMAPVVKAIEQDEYLQSVVVVTAQHREMLDQVLQLFDIVPDYDLNLMKANQTLTDITSGVLQGLEKILQEEKPDIVLVHGDTTTTFAATMAAFYQQIPVGHVEAGLRSGNLYSPYPEEANRKLTGVMATLHFSPTPESRNNLLKENVDDTNIFVTGNTVIDALLATVKDEYQFADVDIQALLDNDAQKVLITAHRRENQGAPMANIFRAVKRLHETLPEVQFIFPIHKNPKVRELAAEILGGLERVYIIEPMDYEPFANVMARVDLILTDSGGLQEEAPALGKPVLVLRDTTERPEAVSAGTVSLVGTDEELIYQTAKTLLTDKKAYGTMANAVNPYGDGLACGRIIAAIEYYFKIRDERPDNWM
ncbi:MAG: UDP-N-acetylglucosamine 2-epimerase (non-hydrolyzing) [Peptococcaceae bacterium]|nr:UDP-N-acetylglucosamine 2-epimerase (non-hydrolyzing) [Peptococcaceae bacterium]